MDKLYKVPKNYHIDYSELSGLPLATQALVMFFYTQRGKPINADCLQIALGWSQRQIKHAVKPLL